MAKYSLSFSELVCHESPPTNSLLGDGDVVPVELGAEPLAVLVTGVDRPDDGEVSVGKQFLLLIILISNKLHIALSDFILYRASAMVNRINNIEE